MRKQRVTSAAGATSIEDRAYRCRALVRRYRALEARPCRETVVIGGKVRGLRQRLGALGELAEVVEDGQHIEVGERHAVAGEVAGFSDGLVEELQLRAHRRDHGFDRVAVGRAVGAFRGDRGRRNGRAFRPSLRSPARSIAR